MRFTLLFILLLSLSLASAATDDAEFVTVVGAQAPTTDVITAANFAANMKLEADATFTGMLDTDFKKLSEDAAAEMLIIIIDGEHVEIFVGEDAPETHNIVAQRSLSYFKTLGFDAVLTFRETVNPQTVSIRNERTAPVPEKPSVQVCDGCAAGDECYAEGDLIGFEYCDGSDLQPLKGNGESCTEDYECLTACSEGICGQEAPEPVEVEENAVPEPVEEKPGFFKRVFSFFFGWLS